MHDLAPRRQDRAPAVLPATKFDAPRRRPEHLPRERQLARVDPHARLLLVCAPAGYGKTTLVGQWIARDPERARAAWIQLAPEDDGVGAFWIAIVSGIAAACPTVGRRSLGALAGPLADVRAAVLAPLIDDLRAYGGELDLVLDDLQVVSDPAAHATLAWLVENAPANLRIAIATRHAPGLPLGRLRARGELTELRAADLRFDADDAECFLNGRLGLALSDADVAALARRTEGWPAGLYLAALSLRGVEDRSQFVAAFAGDDELIVDYLGPELLRGLDRQTRAFLLRTSILESFCAPLCAAVAGLERPAEEVLGELARTNLFLVSLDRRRRWFRYERMFAELLRAELQAAEPALVPELQRRAAAWHDGEGRPAATVAHDLRAGDREAAALRAGRRRALVTASDGRDRLSDRELDVLRLLGGTLSLRSIARELYVAHNTIKTHTRAIYRKLGAASRAEAVARARELRLL